MDVGVGGENPETDVIDAEAGRPNQVTKTTHASTKITKDAAAKTRQTKAPNSNKKNTSSKHTYKCIKNCKLLHSIAVNNFNNVPHVSLERIDKSLIPKVC